jgi:hypothetical protein
MTELFLALALAAPADGAPGVFPSADAACSVTVAAIDAGGRERATRQVSAALVPALVFRAPFAPRRAGAPPLVFDVFNPRGQRYRVLAPTTRGAVSLPLRGSPRPARTIEARLAVAGSSIAWTSMYGRWRVVPRFEGRDGACGPSTVFTILP